MVVCPLSHSEISKTMAATFQPWPWTRCSLTLSTLSSMFNYQLKRRGVIVIKKVFDAGTVAQMESELQKYLLDSPVEDGIDVDVFW